MHAHTHAALPLSISLSHSLGVLFTNIHIVPSSSSTRDGDPGSLPTALLNVDRHARVAMCMPHTHCPFVEPVSRWCPRLAANCSTQGRQLRTRSSVYA